MSIPKGTEVAARLIETSVRFAMNVTNSVDTLRLAATQVSVDTSGNTKLTITFDDGKQEVDVVLDVKLMDVRRSFATPTPHVEPDNRAVQALVEFGMPLTESMADVERYGEDAIMRGLAETPPNDE